MNQSTLTFALKYLSSGKRFEAGKRKRSQKKLLSHDLDNLVAQEIKAPEVNALLYRNNPFYPFLLQLAKVVKKSLNMETSSNPGTDEEGQEMDRKAKTAEQGSGENAVHFSLYDSKGNYPRNIFGFPLRLDSQDQNGERTIKTRQFLVSKLAKGSQFQVKMLTIKKIKRTLKVLGTLLILLRSLKI